MNCPFCGHKEDKVIDSRESKEGDVVRRRRQCLGCERRFTTYERSDEIPYMVVKKDGRREKFDRQKVLNGLLKACEKRPVAMAKLAEVVDAVEAGLADNPDREISTTEIGETLMERLKNLDKIAYVRFASVYRDFQDVEAFLSAKKNLLINKPTKYLYQEVLGNQKVARRPESPVQSGRRQSWCNQSGIRTSSI
jgi:transcriptional repressor NrdR